MSRSNKFRPQPCSFAAPACGRRRKPPSLPRRVDVRSMSSSRRFVVPEVIQTSKSDCGPAALKAMLEGFGVRAGYARLREVCRTDVDGTSVDRLEQVANELGLDAEQVVV